MTKKRRVLARDEVMAKISRAKVATRVASFQARLMSAEGKGLAQLG